MLLVNIIKNKWKEIAIGLVLALTIGMCNGCGSDLYPMVDPKNLPKTTPITLGCKEDVKPDYKLMNW